MACIQRNTMIGALAALLFSAAPAVQADSYEDFFMRNMEKRYYPIELPARNIGMGGAYAALKGDLGSVMGNPAGLGWLDGYAISGGYQFDWIRGTDPSSNSKGDESIHRGMILVGASITEQFVIGAGFIPSFGDGDDDFNRETENFIAPFSMAYQFDEYFSIGYGFSYHNDKVESDLMRRGSDPGYLHRFGFLFSLDDCWDLGLVGHYGHGDAKSRVMRVNHFDGDREQWGIRGGSSYTFEERLTVAVDGGYTRADMDGYLLSGWAPGTPRSRYDEKMDIFDFSAGIEYLWMDDVTVRTGAGVTHYDFKTSDVTLDRLINDSTIPHWAGGFTYRFTEQISADTAVQVRFASDVDLLAGLNLNYNF